MTTPAMQQLVDLARQAGAAVMGFYDGVAKVMADAFPMFEPSLAR